MTSFIDKGMKIQILLQKYFGPIGRGWIKVGVETNFAW